MIRRVASSAWWSEKPFARIALRSGTIDVRSVGSELIDLRTVNGGLELMLPADARANLSATVVNGVIDTTGLALDLMGEQTRRRVRGRLNGGGAPIELATTNGPIRVATK